MSEIIIRADEETGSPVVKVVGDNPLGQEVEWFLSETLQAELVKELRSHLGGEFSQDFDSTIKDALSMVS